MKPALAQIVYDENAFMRQMRAWDVFKYDVQDALKFAVNYTTRALNRDVRGELRKVTGLSARIINGRIAVKYAYQSSEGLIWIGLNPISLKRMKPRQTRAGVKAGPVKRDHAFIVGKLGNHVFTRKGDARLPIRKEYYSIDEAGADAVETVRARASAYMKEAFIAYLEKRRGSAKGRYA